MTCQECHAKSICVFFNLIFIIKSTIILQGNKREVEELSEGHS